MKSEILELQGRQFVTAEQWAIADWPCVLEGQPQPTMTIKEDDIFLITDTLGNIAGCVEDDQTTNMGLFYKDSRYLSRLELQIEGRSPIFLSSSAARGFALSVLCANPRLPHIPPETIGIQRELVINAGLFEDIEVSNYNTEPVELTLSLSFDADFVDLFEIRGFGREQRGRLMRMLPPGLTLEEVLSRQTLETDRLVLAYQGLDGVLMESRIHFSHTLPSYFKGQTAVWHLKLEPQAKQRLGYRLALLSHDQNTATSAPSTLTQALAANILDEQEWQHQIARIRTDNEAFNQILDRAEQDVYLLRQSFEQSKFLAAGVPWFSTLFGRDSIIAASQTLILDPTIALETLSLLARFQGENHDPWRDEEPGKILHELRFGEMARCQEIPHTPYYGTIDATPLWIMLYAEYYAWTHDRDTLDRLWPNAIAAMEWIDSSLDERGYLSYARKSKRGLVNQGWKDSGNCIVDSKGHLAEGAIALCEVQAYVYAAKIRLSQIARLRKEHELGDRLEEEARSLKVRFNRDFWLEEEQYCALALDGQGRPVDSITSNPGHCLHLGIFTPEKADSVAERLMAPDLFSGWGIRTLSSQSPAYNPMGYHVGSVWPHDNALTALGLRSTGHMAPALEVAQGIIDMTLEQPYQRPPELFCGYERLTNNSPVQYPVACSPQAWATGSLFQLITLMVNLVPDAPANNLRILDPALLPSLQRLSMQNLRIGSTLLDLEFERSGETLSCRVVKKRGNLRVVIEA